MSKASNERRGAPRADADLPMRLSPRGDAQPARLKNISTTGLCCHFGEPVSEMTMMGVQLELPGEERASDSETHSTQGVVVRCDKRRGVNPPTYEVAIYFTALEADARIAIQRFVMEQLEASAH